MTKSIENQIDVWIVNDSKYMTQLLSDLISKDNIKVTNTARDGAEALRKLSTNKPDVILLDLEMPTMDGLTFIEEVVKQNKLVPIIIVSSFSQEGAKVVLDALENGALDFVPISTTNPGQIQELKENLISKIEVASKCEPNHLIIKNIQKLKPKKKIIAAPNAATRVIVIGSSTGGPNTLQSIISALPADLKAAILVVQHMPKEFTGPLALRLDETCQLPVKEAEEGDVIKEGTVLVARGGYHMIVESNMRIKLIDGPKRFGVKPAVNMTMVSASEVFGSNTIGILLTGMGHDGAFGMKTIKKRGGHTIAQDSSSSVIYGMPKAAVDLHAVDKLLPTAKIPQTIQELVENLSENNYRDMYLTEALEHVEIMNQALLKLEDEPEEKKHLDLIFRSAHTIKGMAATMGYEQTKDLCKNIENIFDNIRKNQQKLTHNLASSLFKCLDVLQQMINDENKKIDLESYLSILKNPDEPQQIEITESIQSSQLPTIRVKMSDLDALVNLVGELIISKMKLENTLREDASVKSKTALLEVGRLVSDLQYQSLKLRLVSIDSIFNRSERVVRDTANKLGKKINLQIDGSKIELDRTILDAISDPLLHILRNCVDHGIEKPSERKVLKKTETGIIKLSAYHVGEQIAIKIEDDGKGIDLERVKAKAVENGIITESEAKELSEQKTIDLLGTPGLSTAKTVTDISGRGVGMDVVINKVRDIGGNIQISTEMGKGTTMILLLPLSVSIIGGLLVNISNEKFVLPLSSITTTLKINNNEIKSLHGVEVIEHHDKIIPLVRVSEILKLQQDKQIEQNKVTIIIVDKGGKPYGLVVDSFDHKQEIVIKKFNNTSDSENSFRNATILPNGKVALILDPGMII